MDTTTPSTAPGTSEGLRFVLGAPHADIFAILDEIIKDGGVSRIGVQERAQNVLTDGRQAGFRYLADGWIQGEILLGFPLEGGFSLSCTLASEGLLDTRTDVYADSGAHVRSYPGHATNLRNVETLEMELQCPLLNHLYNMLAAEYAQATSGTVRSVQVHTIERFLRTRERKGILSGLFERRNDPLFRHAFHRMLIIEADPVLKWEERQVVYQGLLTNLSRALKTKQRALGHRVGTPGQKLRFRLKAMARRLKMRPWDNAQGLFYKYTIEKMLWFFHTVRNNLGYSVALAVYGPFTYYFITMPMNPHAMQAVGRVRTAYIDTKSEVSKMWHLITPGNHEALETDIPALPEPAVTETSPTQNTPGPVIATPRPDVVEKSAVTATGRSVPLMLAGATQNVHPAHLNMLLGTDVPAVDALTWTERMGQFKQMQIGYEEGMELAPRMGRLEQLETQYNFPMVVESTWEEMERYNAQIFRLRQRHPSLSPRLKQYMVNEVNRTQQLELYLWDRLARFILDQPYVMLDQDKEQKRSDYYVGRAFVFMEEMTKVMGWRYPDFKKPQGYDKIAAQAKGYIARRKNSGDIMDNLKANSDLFKQKDVYSTKQFRSYMKRQWEILYLQNAKAEEASNNGLNMYIWSVRNTIWCLQSIYSAKRTELDLLLQKDLEGQLDGAAKTEIAKIENLYETLFHNLTMEWVGIRQELGQHLGKDVETAQRQIVVENLREFLTDRSKLFPPVAQATAQAEQPVRP